MTLTINPAARPARKPTLVQLREMLDAAEETQWVCLTCPCGPVRVAVIAEDTPETLLAKVLAKRARTMPACTHVDR